MPQSSIDRRTFLTLVSMASGFAALGTARALGGTRAVVLGGGLAGLATAWNLTNKGYDVVVLEAQDRPGGRVQTIRDPFEHGGYAEAGAVRIPSSHTWTMKYIRLMGLESKLRDYADDAGAHLWYLRGKRFITPTGTWPLDGLSPRERADPFGMIGTYWGPGFAAVGDPRAAEFPGASARELDRYTIVDYLKKNGASDAWAQLILASEGDARRMNALAVTMAEAAVADGSATSTYGLMGGNDQLPTAMATALGDRVKYRAPVLRISHNHDEVVITFRDSAGQQQLRADHCVCTLPFPVLRDVDVTPAFSNEKMSAIRRYQLMPMARLYFQTKTRFWRADPIGPLGGLNMIGTDTIAERIWNTSLLQPDPNMGMLHSYMIDRQAQLFAGTPPEQRVEQWRAAISGFLPDLKGQIAATYTKVWQDDPWQKGGFAFLQPNELPSIWPAARKAEGRVHFAGEHTSPWFGLAERRLGVCGTHGRRDRRVDRLMSGRVQRMPSSGTFAARIRLLPR